MSLSRFDYAATVGRDQGLGSVDATDPRTSCTRKDVDAAFCVEDLFGGVHATKAAFPVLVANQAVPAQVGSH
ncbi:MAG: hypothetical protein AAF968_00500 [Pseudomonadota bacterium]